ncbi:FAD-dependent oxidoreductase [Aspergillus affinis]|uniref:FAD-dependent oxidoreductase n=1 Tax=Aspergillus affinis TaxID=1070780 RepID=UPI0022FEC2C6|nr:FAD-binding domain-containing protein [Aspergillus affinis]KAI9035172.1 FAD-binding domain-containing protein [Aspergillus affinis]
MKASLWTYSYLLFWTGVVEARSACRYLPGDAEWPSDSAWARLNRTVNNRLIATVPLGSPCHDEAVDAARCDELKEQWVYPQLHVEDPSSIVAPYFQNQSCDPFTSPSSPCRIGNYVEYAINVSTAADVAAGLVFAQKWNIRLVIKNTGHDLLGRSTGKGALGLWMHNLRSLLLSNYRSSHYTGKTITMGAGVQAFEAYAFAAQHHLRVVGGTCSTVGLSGGYTQGGGHSMLSTQYGLGADQVLEWEVVLANGSHVRASPASHPDLYWALSGGGGGTFAVVLSMTVKAHVDTPVTGASLTVSQKSSSPDAADQFWHAVDAFHAAMPSWIDAGAATGYYLVDGALSLIPATFPNRTAAEAEALMKPFLQRLDALDALAISFNVSSFPGYLPFFDHYFGPLPYGAYTSAQVQGGRLVPRAVLTSPESNAALTTALRTVTSHGAFHVVGVGLDVSNAAAPSNAVHPGWRKAATTLVVAANWDYERPFADNAAHETLITEQFDPLLQEITGPESGAYMNEGDFRQGDFRRQFFGDNYGPLRAIKRRYDPREVFYGTAMVGSDGWRVERDGRLCRV